MTRDEKIEGLRALADLLEQHEQIPAPHFSTFFAYGSDAELMASIASVPGRWDKTYDEADDFRLTRHLAGSLDFVVFCPRETVCTAVATEEVTETEPDPEYVARAVARAKETAPLIQTTKTVVTEWDCHPILKVGA